MNAKISAELNQLLRYYQALGMEQEIYQDDQTVTGSSVSFTFHNVSRQYEFPSVEGLNGDLPAQEHFTVKHDSTDSLYDLKRDRVLESGNWRLIEKVSCGEYMDENFDATLKCTIQRLDGESLEAAPSPRRAKAPALR